MSCKTCSAWCSVLRGLPAFDCVEGLFVGEVKHEDEPHGSAVVGRGDGAVALLPRSVPDLQLYSLVLSERERGRGREGGRGEMRDGGKEEGREAGNETQLMSQLMNLPLHKLSVHPSQCKTNTHTHTHTSQ